MTTLSEQDVQERLSALEGWDREGDEIVKQFELRDFKASLAFVVRVAFEAEAANHHPDIDIRWNKVRLALSTHSEGGLTVKDFDLATAIEAIAREGG